MLLAIIQMTACATLIGAAIFWRIRHGNAANAHRFLFPYILIASTSGVLALCLHAMETFVAYHSGATYLVVIGPYQWHRAAFDLLPFLPIAGIFPPIGRRPLLMAGLGFLALISCIFS